MVFSVGRAVRTSLYSPGTGGPEARRKAIAFCFACGPARTSCAVVRASRSHPVRLPDSPPRAFDRRCKATAKRPLGRPRVREG